MHSRSGGSLDGTTPCTNEHEAAGLHVASDETTAGGYTEGAYRIDGHVASVVLLNLVSGVGVVMGNNAVYAQLPYATTLLLLHLVTTFIGLEICRLVGLFEFKPLKIQKVMPISMCFCGFILTSQILVTTSKVVGGSGVYQFIRGLTLPVVACIDILCHGATYTVPLLGALTVVCIGGIIATVHLDATFHVAGAFTALCALLFSSAYYILIQSKHKELECNSWQLLYYHAPLSALMLIPVALRFDDATAMMQQGIPETQLLLILGVTSGVAFVANMTTFLIIGRAGAVAYNVLGHCKLMIALLMGSLFFAHPITVTGTVGLILMTIGVLWYTRYRAGSD